MNPLDLVKLTALMEIASGRAETIIGLIDGPVAKNHPDLLGDKIRDVLGKGNSQCTQTNGLACSHGTFVAGILCGKRGSIAPAICPNCTLLVRPIFAETTVDSLQMPSTTPEEVARGIFECIEAGAKVLNLSVAFVQPSSQGQQELEEVLDYAAKQGVITVAAAGNQGTLGSSAITRHPGVIPVVACDLQGLPMSQSNFGSSIGRRGLSAPGENITSLGVEGNPLTLGGTSAAAPFVTGTTALLWSEFPPASVAEIKLAITQAYKPKRVKLIPPLLNAWEAYQTMLRNRP